MACLLLPTNRFSRVAGFERQAATVLAAMAGRGVTLAASPSTHTAAWPG